MITVHLMKQIISSWQQRLLDLKDRFIKYQTQKYIFLLSIIAVIVYFAVYLLYSFCQYPQLILNQASLYGEQSQNLKDFEIEGKGIRSTSSDPWIEYHLDQPVKIKVIELDISGITEDTLEGRIFDTDTWNSVAYHVKNGKLHVFFHDRENLEKENLRFDLVESSSTYLEVEQITINSRYGLFCRAMKYMLLSMIYLSIYETVLFILYDYLKNSSAGFKRKKVASLICIASPFAFMIDLLYLILFRSVRDSLMLWMYLLILVSMLMLIVHMENSRKESIILEFTGILLSACLSVGIAEILSGIEYNFENPGALLLNILLAMLPALILYCIIRNVKWAITVSHVLIFIIAVINHYFYQFRGNPLELSDFLLVGTALTVIGNYEFKISQELFFCLIFEFCVIYCVMSADRKTVKRSGFLVSLSLSCLILLMGTLYTPPVSYWNMVATTQSYGYISSFVAYAKHDMIHRKPAGYSRENVFNVLEQYEFKQENQVTEEYPNIIVIMNESFADLPETYGFATAEDGMPFIHSLTENTIKGTVLTSVFGGSTANTEYEFLTGNTMAFLSEGNVPYVQFVKSEQESLVHDLNVLGYQTIAFHPCAAGNYNRNKVYPLLGFEKFITEEDELLHTENLRTYMSDQTDFLNLIDIYERRDRTRPFFLFNVTMQNHGGYSHYKSEVDVTVIPESEKLRSAQLLEYLSLIRTTDSAFQTLVEYFEKEDARTMILMFGDHQPGLDTGIYDDMLQIGEPALSERSELSYITPFVLWTNYDLESEDNILTSPNYLRTMLLEQAKIPFSSYDRFLSACQKKYPAINCMGYYDASGSFHPAEDLLESYGMLWEYWLLQYANMFDRSIWK